MQIWLPRAVSFFSVVVFGPSRPPSTTRGGHFDSLARSLWRGMRAKRRPLLVLCHSGGGPPSQDLASRPEPKPVTPFCSCPTDDDDRLLQLLALAGIFRSKLVKFLLMVEFMQILRLPDFSARPVVGTFKVVGIWRSVCGEVMGKRSTWTPNLSFARVIKSWE